MSSDVAAGKEALARHSWEEAFQALAQADRAQELAAEDLELLADAAWWSGRSDEAVATLERAFTAHIQVGRNLQAAAMAVRLAERAMRSVAVSVAQGWLARAEHLLDGEPESAVHAWYEFTRSAQALLINNDPALAITHADRAIEIGSRHQDLDVQAIAMSFKGSAMMRLGQIEDGLALIDEAAAAATSGELHPKTACDVYCFTISTCRDLPDYRRAGEWTARADSFMERESIHGYPGVCRVHRAELKRLQGQWSEAETEAISACDELEKFRLLDVLGFAYSEIGEVRRRKGDLAGADQAFQKAYELGTDPQPGLALMLLQRGEPDEAARAIQRSLNETSPETGLLRRAHLLPAQVEIALANGDAETAQGATEELETIAAEHEMPIWQASAMTARGNLEMHTGQISEAINTLSQAWRSWQQLDLPYEAARTRRALGESRRISGDEAGAELELKAALSALRRLGAATEVAHLEDFLGESAPRAAESRVTRTFVFTDIVTSTDLIEIIGDEAWDSLLGWHDRTLRSIFSSHGGEVVSHTGDGFFVVFKEPSGAIDCAIAVQKTLQHHRTEHGFAPWLRIGIHRAEATRGRGNYTGRGVHLASRVAALGDRDEIVVSASTLEGLETADLTISEPRTVSVKGITEPVIVRTVAWST